MARNEKLDRCIFLFEHKEQDYDQLNNVLIVSNSLKHAVEVFKRDIEEYRGSVDSFKSKEIGKTHLECGIIMTDY